MALDVYKQWLGIPEEFRPPTHYQLLRLVDFEDDVSKIETYYKKLNSHVRKYATGQYSIESQELLNELAKAMLCLTDPVRKREYDSGKGREFTEEEAANLTTGEILVHDGTISSDQLREVDDFAERRGILVRDALVQMKLADQETATRALAGERRLSYATLADLPPDDSILDCVPRSTVKRNSILPLFVDDEMLLIACADQPSQQLEEELRMRFSIPLRPVLATPLSINQAIAQHYAPGMREEAKQYVNPNAAQTTTGKTSGAKSRKKKKENKKEKITTNEPKLSPKELKEKKQTGYVIILFSFLAASVLANFVVLPFFFRTWIGTTYSYLATVIMMIIIVPPCSLFAYHKYLK